MYKQVMSNEIRKASEKKPFSVLVGEAVDQLSIREYYKWANNKKIALHVKELMKILLANHAKVVTPQRSNSETRGDRVVEDKQNNRWLVVQQSLDMWLQQLTQEHGVGQFYAALPAMMINSPQISPHDRLLCQTVMMLMVTLNFDIHNDIEILSDPVTEILTTTDVPDWKKIRHYIDKKTVIADNHSVWFIDRNKLAWRLNVEELYHFDMNQVAEDIGIDDEFKKMRLKRIVQWGVNVLSHTPFEYFHDFERFETNDKQRPIYMLRTYLRARKGAEKTASIIALLDKDYNFLNPDFPVIDDPQTKEFVLVNAFGTLSVGRADGDILFFEYKKQLYIIKNGKYMLPGFADQLAGKKIHHLKASAEKRWYFDVCTEGKWYVTDNRLRVLWESVEEVQKLIKTYKPKK